MAGQGLALLRQAGVAGETGLLAEAAAELNAGYLLRQTAGRPLVSLKLATSLDGRLATATGESRWITGPEARVRAHLLRAQSDAVLVGSGTALADDPRLDVRLAGLEERAPLRVLLDGGLRLPPKHDLVQRAKAQPTLVFTRPGHPKKRTAPLRDAGVELIEIAQGAEDRLDLAAVLQALGGRGCNNLLVEGGGQVAAGLLALGLVERIAWFRAARVIGGDGLPAVAALGLQQLGAAPQFVLTGTEILGDDRLEHYRRGT